jgi:RimJ/RimL family protein N-acetyltransferase
MNHSITIQKLKSIINNYNVGNVAFRNFAKSDVFPLIRATTNENFNKYLTWNPRNEEDMILEVKRLMNEERQNKSISISICEKYTGTWAGFIKFIPYLEGLEISLWIHPDFWNTKTSYVSSAMAIQIVLEQTTIEKIYCRISNENIAVKRLVDAFGFNYIEQTEVVHEDGQLILLNRYDLINKDFKLSRVLNEY